jgi:hypothetical protein
MQIQRVWLTRFAPRSGSPVVELPFERPQHYSPPDFFSHSGLLQATECERRFVWSRSKYPNTWAGFGYPQAPNRKQVLGQVVHKVVDDFVTQARSFKGSLVDVATACGGFTRMIEAASLEVLDRQLPNPLAAPLRRHLEATLKESLPEIRFLVQRILQTLPRIREDVIPASLLQISSDQDPLPVGVYSEVSLKSTSLNLMGVIDLLIIGPKSDKIVDIKTGVHRDEHAQQLLTYGMLWRESNLRTPEKPFELELQYSDIDILKVDFSQATLAEHKTELVELQRRLTNIANCEMAEATIGPSCVHCTVRHLCAEYWQRPQSVNEISDLKIHRIGDALNAVPEFFEQQAGRMRVSAELTQYLEDWESAIILNAHIDRISNDRDDDSDSTETFRIGLSMNSILYKLS